MLNIWSELVKTSSSRISSNIYILELLFTMLLLDLHSKLLMMLARVASQCTGREPSQRSVSQIDLQTSIATVMLLFGFTSLLSVRIRIIIRLLHKSDSFAFPPACSAPINLLVRGISQTYYVPFFLHFHPFRPLSYVHCIYEV